MLRPRQIAGCDGVAQDFVTQPPRGRSGRFSQKTGALLTVAQDLVRDVRLFQALHFFGG